MIVTALSCCTRRTDMYTLNCMSPGDIKLSGALHMALSTLSLTLKNKNTELVIPRCMSKFQ